MNNYNFELLFDVWIIIFTVMFLATLMFIIFTFMIAILATLFTLTLIAAGIAAGIAFLLLL